MADKTDNKMKQLTQTNDYLLLIDEDAEIKVSDFITDTYNVWQWKDDSSLLGRKLVMAYYPLSKEAKELDLPLLPNPFEEVDINKIIDEGNYGYHDESIDNFYREGFRDGYKAASKQFSLEDMKKAMELGLTLIDGNVHNQERFEGFIQSLSTKQLPKEFIPEYDLMNEGYDKPEDYPYQECKVLKTIINPKSKQEIVGVYKY